MILTFTTSTNVLLPSRKSWMRGSPSTLSRCPLRRDRSSNVRFLRMVAEDQDREVGDVVVEKIERQVGSGLIAKFGGLGRGLRGVVAVGVVCVGAFGGWTAGSRIGKEREELYGGLGGLAGAAASAVAVRQVEKKGKKSIKAEVARRARSGKLETSDLEEVRKRFGVREEEFQEVKTSVYEEWLKNVVSRREVKHSEMAELVKLKRAMGLSGINIGDAHYETARAFYRENVVWLDAEDMEDERQDSQEKLNKLLFLSDRLFCDREDEEAYRYESARLRKVFGLTEDQAKQRIASIALPFYKQVVVRAAVDSSISAADLEAAQNTLGVSDREADLVRHDAYAERVNSLVSQKGKLDAVDNEALSRLRTLFNIAEDRATATLKSFAEPVYRMDVRRALEAVEKGEESFASIYGKLALRQSELGMPIGTPRAATAAEVSTRVVDFLTKASKSLRVQNLSGTLQVLDELLTFIDGVVSLLRKADDKATAKSIISTYVVDAEKRSLSKTEPLQLYRIYMSHCLADRKIDENEKEALSRLSAILNLSEIDASTAYKAAAGPVYRKAVANAVNPSTASTMSTLDEANKEVLVKLRTDLALPQDTVTEIHVARYEDKLGSFVVDNRVLNESEAQLLASLRAFLDLTNEDVAPVHARLCGSVYAQSVAEAMGPTGIMLDTYRSGLERLRVRLGITEHDANEAFNKVARARMRLYAERALAELQKRGSLRAQTATTPTGKQRDTGEDPYIKRAGAVLGIEAGGVTVELANLVDFYVRNKIPIEEEIEVDVEVDSPTDNAGGGDTKPETVKTMKKEKRKIIKYPITLKGVIPEKPMTDLYKSYVVQCFAASTREEKQKLFGALDQLGSILGMSDEQVANTHSEIGTVIYKNYLKEALNKGRLEQKDMEFLSNIQRMLSMSEEKCTRLTKDAKETLLNSLIQQVFSKAKVDLSTVKRIRQMAKTLDVDMVKDLKIGNEMREKLFSMEVDGAIETGAVTSDNQSLINEVQTDFQLDDTAAKNALLKCIQRRTVSHLVQASASLRLNSPDSAVKELEKMLTFGKLLPAKVTAAAVSQSEKQELYLLYQAQLITEEKVTDQMKGDLTLLKVMLGFSDNDVETFKVR